MNKIPNNLVIHCHTKRLAEEVLQCLHDLGYTWSSGEWYSPKRTHWDLYKVETCYCLSGTFGPSSCYTCGYQHITGIDFLKQYGLTSNMLRLKKLNRIKLKFAL